MKKTMTNTAEICARLKCLFGVKETPEAFDEVKTAISLRYIDVKYVAAQVLGDWGSPQAKDLLKKALIESYYRKQNYQLRGVIVKALSSCLSEADSSWLLEHYFDVNGVLNKHELLPAVLALPPDSARQRLVLESKSENRDNRQAAMKAIAHIGFKDRNQLLSRFVQDQDKGIRKAASYLINKST